MSPNNSEPTSDSYKTSLILEIINSKKPRTIKQLVQLVHQNTKLEADTIYCIIKKLECEGKLKLRNGSSVPSISSFKTYFFQKNYFSIEFWIILAFSIFFVLTVFIDEHSIFFFIRVITSFLYSIFVPGWLFANIVFPRPYWRIDQFERFLIANISSLVILLILGLSMSFISIINSFTLSISVVLGSSVMQILSTCLRLLISRQQFQCI